MATIVAFLILTQILCIGAVGNLKDDSTAKMIAGIIGCIICVAILILFIVSSQTEYSLGYKDCLEGKTERMKTITKDNYRYVLDVNNNVVYKYVIINDTSYVEVKLGE